MTNSQHHWQDARLKKALEHAPDADMRPSPAIRQAILDAAQQAAAQSPTVSPQPVLPHTATPASLWIQRLWDRLSDRANMPWNAAFATFLIAGCIALLWSLNDPHSLLNPPTPDLATPAPYRDTPVSASAPSPKPEPSSIPAVQAPEALSVPTPSVSMPGTASENAANESVSSPVVTQSDHRPPVVLPPPMEQAPPAKPAQVQAPQAPTGVGAANQESRRNDADKALELAPVAAPAPAPAPDFYAPSADSPSPTESKASQSAPAWDGAITQRYPSPVTGSMGNSVPAHPYVRERTTSESGRRSQSGIAAHDSRASDFNVSGTAGASMPHGSDEAAQGRMITSPPPMGQATRSETAPVAESLELLHTETRNAQDEQRYPSQATMQQALRGWTSLKITSSGITTTLTRSQAPQLALTLGRMADSLNTLGNDPARQNDFEKQPGATRWRFYAGSRLLGTWQVHQNLWYFTPEPSREALAPLHGALTPQWQKALESELRRTIP